VIPRGLVNAPGRGGTERLRRADCDGADDAEAETGGCALPESATYTLRLIDRERVRAVELRRAAFASTKPGCPGVRERADVAQRRDPADHMVLRVGHVQEPARDRDASGALNARPRVASTKPAARVRPLAWWRAPG